jgi:UDP-glucose 4-epimerase
MKVMVAGGAGYIGSVVAEELLEEGHSVLVVDDLSKGHREALPQAATFVEADLADAGGLPGLLTAHRIGAVMHFAADSLVEESVARPARYFRRNAVNTLNLLEAMLAVGVKRFVLSSTAAVYGEPKRVPIEEDDALAPTNPYGESKLMVERMLRWLDAAHGLRYASLRYFNAAGASRERGEDHRPETHLIPIVLQVALGQREQVEIYGDDYPTRDGTCIRDYIHVVDLAQAHILALEALDEGSRIYNLGNGQGFTVREVIEASRRVTGHSIPAVEAARRSGDPAVLVASSRRISEELGWQPRFADLETIVATAWDWHHRHPRGYG